jgi:hypothetical protein
MRDIIAMAVASGLFLSLAVAATASRSLQTYLDQSHVALSAYPASAG